MKTMKVKIPEKCPVFSPEKNEYIKGDQEVPRSPYWLRRLKDKECELVKETKSEKKI